MDDSSTLQKKQQRKDDSATIPEEWEKLFDKNEINKVGIETIQKWMDNPKKDRFINWKNDDILDGKTMLLCAIMYERWDIAKLLVEHGADITIVDKKGSTALMWAACWGHAEFVEQLLEKRADITTVDKDGNTALIWAATGGQAKVVELLLELDADINTANKFGNTALIWAFKKGHTKIVELLVEKGADINIAASKDGWTSLMWASHNGHAKIAEHLVEKGADIAIADKDGNTALNLASSGGQTDIVEFLLGKGADIKVADKKNGMTALMWASYKGYTKIVALLVDKGADLNIGNKNGITALMWASRGGHANVVKLLLDKQAGMNIANKNGDTALVAAFQGGHTKVVELLLNKGADPNVASSKDGSTALIWAVKERQPDTVELLLEKGADCKITNTHGRTPFTEAYYQGNTNMVDLLLEKAPLKDIIHDVVLFPGCAGKFLGLYKQNRNIVNWRDEEGRTVRQMACKECREAILFMGQYDMDDQPLYESPTCKIFSALDYGDPDEPDLEEPRRVAMKFMEEEDHFLNEIRTRRNDDGSPRFSSEFVTPDLASYRADEHLAYAQACTTWKTNDVLPDYCIVMPQAERSLLEAVNAENLSAKHKDLQRREILSTLCEIFSYLHEVGYVHGDIKPHNVVRHMDGHVTWKAIDFDACTKTGNVVGLKLTTGSVPPEMLKTMQNKDASPDTESLRESTVILRQPGGDLDESDLVKADPSFDVWSFGILMYQLITGRSFFHCDNQGNVDEAGLYELANLTERRIHEKLASVKHDVNARVLLSRILRLDPTERPTMSEIGEDYYFHPSKNPQGRKADFFGKQVFSIFVPENDALAVSASTYASAASDVLETSDREKDDDDISENMEELERFILSSQAEFSYFKLRDEDKDWSDKLLHSEVETFRFDNLEGMGEKPKFIDGDSIYNNKFLRSLLSNKGPDYFMGFLVEYFELYQIMQDAHEVCQGIKANLVSDVKGLKGIFIKLFVRGKGLNDIVRGTLFCDSIDQFKYVGRQLKEKYDHNVYIKPPKQEAGSWPIPKLLIYCKKKIDGRCMSVEIQFSTIYMHLALHASNSHVVYEAMRESTGYLGNKDTQFQEFLQSLNRQYIDTEGFLRIQGGQEGRFEILVEKLDEGESGQESDKQYITEATGFILSGQVRCGERLFRLMKSEDCLNKFSESSFVVNKNLTLLSSQTYWSDESYDLEDKSVEFVVSFKGRGLAVAGIGTAQCLHGSTESDGGGERCSVNVGRSKFVVRKSGVEKVFREKKLPNQERAKIIFKMKDGVLSVSFVGSQSDDDEEIESVQVGMPSDQRFHLYMRAPPGVHDVKFHDVNIV